MQNNIQWVQKLINFKKAFKLLESAVKTNAWEEYTALQKDGVIHRFEYTYDLAWKTL